MESVKTEKYNEVRTEEDEHMENWGHIKDEPTDEQEEIKIDEIKIEEFYNHPMDLGHRNMIENEIESKYLIDNSNDARSLILNEEANVLKKELTVLRNETDVGQTDVVVTERNNFFSHFLDASIDSKCDFEEIKEENAETESDKNIDIDEINIFKCNECSYITKYKQCLTRHRIIHKSADEATFYYCYLCNFKTKHRVSLKTHLASNRHKSLESVTTPEDSELQDRCIIQDEKLQCELCPYMTRSKHNYTKHLLKHKNPQDCTMYKCDVCSYKTKRKGNMTNHMLTHKNIDDVKCFKCQLCDFKTKFQSTMSSHVLTHKDPNELKMFKCPKCSYQAKYKKSLTRHLSKTRCSNQKRETTNLMQQNHLSEVGKMEWL